MNFSPFKNDLDMSRNLTRGERNNNPGNIRQSGDKWVGQIGIDNGGGSKFVIFKDMVYGVRAFYINLFNSYFQIKNKKNLKPFNFLNTIEKIIPKYAPASDNNNEQAYINNLVAITGFAKDKEFCFLDKSDMLVLGRGFFRCEGTSDSVSDLDISKGYEMALSYLVGCPYWKYYECYGSKMNQTILPVEINGYTNPKKDDQKKDFDIKEFLKKYWYLLLIPFGLIYLLIKRK